MDRAEGEAVADDRRALRVGVVDDVCGLQQRPFAQRADGAAVAVLRVHEGVALPDHDEVPQDLGARDEVVETPRERMQMLDRCESYTEVRIRGRGLSLVGRGRASGFARVDGAAAMASGQFAGNAFKE